MKKQSVGKLQHLSSFYLYKPELIALFELIDSNFKDFEFVLGEYKIENVVDFESKELSGYKTNDLDVTTYDPFLHFYDHDSVSMIQISDKINAKLLGMEKMISDIREESWKKYGKPRRTTDGTFLIRNENHSSNQTDSEKTVNVKIVDEKAPFLKKHRDEILLLILGTFLGSLFTYIFTRI